VLGVALLVVAACGGERSESGRPADRLDAGPGDSALTALSALPAVLFLGTSLTAGYGLDESEAYPALIQLKIDSAGLPYRVVNAGVSGETSAGGLRRIDWLLRQPVAVLVLELGANDGLRGQDVAAMRANLQTIIDRTRAMHPEARVVIAGMESPPNMGRSYTGEFRAVFPELARANGATLIPFLLDGVAAVPELNQADGIHPTAEGQRRVAEIVWRYLEPVLRGDGSDGSDGNDGNDGNEGSDGSDVLTA
jgi:acyl-CoA thioesterase-1